MQDVEGSGVKIRDKINRIFFFKNVSLKTKMALGSVV